METFKKSVNLPYMGIFSLHHKKYSNGDFVHFFYCNDLHRTNISEIIADTGLILKYIVRRMRHFKN